MKTAIPYARFSSVKQAEGSSEVRQDSTIRQFVAYNNWQIDETLCFGDFGKSAFHGQHKALAAFVETCEKRRHELPDECVLVCDTHCRFSRQGFEVAYGMLCRVVKAGVSVAFASERKIYTRQSIGKTGDIMDMLIRFQLAHEDSDKKSKWTKKNWGMMRQTGIARRIRGDKAGTPVGKKPAWILVDGTKYKADKVKAETIKKIFAWTIDGLGSRQIIKRLQKAGIKSIAAGSSKASKGEWNGSYIKSIINNRSVLGEYQPQTVEEFIRVQEEQTVAKRKYKVGELVRVQEDEQGPSGELFVRRVPLGDPIQDYFPRIIEDDVFEAAQSAIRGRFRPRAAGKNVCNLFSGILTDTKTGSHIRLVNSSKQDKQKGIMRRIASYDAVNRGARHYTWGYEEFEKLALWSLYQVKTNQVKPNMGNPIPALQADLDQVKANIAETQAKLKSRNNFTAAMRVLEDLQDEQEKLEGMIANAKQVRQAAKMGTLDNYRTAFQALQDCKPQEREALRAKIKVVLRSLVQSGTVEVNWVQGNRLKKTIDCKFMLNNGEVAGFRAASWKGGLCAFALLCPSGSYMTPKRISELMDYLDSIGVSTAEQANELLKKLESAA